MASDSQLFWMCSSWCNYSCSYCDQDHRRTAGHCFDTATPLQWYEAFRHAFQDRRMYFSISGGEPLLHYKLMELLLLMLAGEPWVDWIRVDTNGSTLNRLKPLPKVKLMVSYHPEMETETEFLRKLDAALADGWQVLMVTQVHNGAPLLSRCPVPYNLNPLCGKVHQYSEELMRTLFAATPSSDIACRMGGSTRGRMCEYPSRAWEADWTGRIEVACHPEQVGNLLERDLPVRPEAAVACPWERCTCVDRYTNLVGFPHEPGVEAYSRRLPLQLV